MGFVHKREETGKGDRQTYWWGLGSEVDAMPICCGEKRAESESKSTASRCVNLLALCSQALGSK